MDHLRKSLFTQIIIVATFATLILPLNNSLILGTPAVLAVGPFNFTTTMSMGATDASTGGQVSMLQQALNADGVYPEGLITGYFGTLTKNALTRFQEKYAADILTPIGLTQGTGIVGALTRAKLNALYGPTGTSLIPIPSPTNGSTGGPSSSNSISGASDSSNGSPLTPLLPLLAPPNPSEAVKNMIQKIFGDAFGGKIGIVIPCTCMPGFTLINVIPVSTSTVPSPTPSPDSTLLRSLGGWFLVEPTTKVIGTIAPGLWTLGYAKGLPLTCLIATPSGCVPAGLGKGITIIGTSAACIMSLGCHK